MDYRLLFAALGLLFGLTGYLLLRRSRSAGNARLLSSGALAEGVVIESRAVVTRYSYTTVTYSFVPEGKTGSVQVTQQLDGAVDLKSGEKVAVRYLRSHPATSIIVGHEP